MNSNNNRPVRGHALWYAHIIHRVSGIALALFLELVASTIHPSAHKRDRKSNPAHQKHKQ